MRGAAVSTFAVLAHSKGGRTLEPFPARNLQCRDMFLLPAVLVKNWSGFSFIDETLLRHRRGGALHGSSVRLL